MDENSGNTTDKRNWRERLGIGKGAASPDMPKIADDFKVAGNTAAPADQRGPSVGSSASTPKPGTARPAAPLAPRPTAAPMAPRPAARPATPLPATTQAGSARPAAPRVPPMASDALANKLRDQREAAEKLAIQRVQAAKQRAESVVQPGSNLGTKPKFSFADEDRGGPSAPTVLPSLPPRTSAQPAGTVPPQRNAAPPVQTETARPAPINPMAPPPAVPSFSPQPAPTFQPQMQPPRPQLGTPPTFAGQAAFPRPAQTSNPPPPQSPFQPPYQAPYTGAGFTQPPPAYRPIEPQQGGFPGQAGRGGFAVPPLPPRGTIPARPPFQQASAPGPKISVPGRGPQVALGPALTSDAEADDVFEPTPVRAPRRATANEYQQAYRDEMAYDDEPPRSRGLGMILGLVLLGLLVAFGVVFGYSRFIKTAHVATSGNSVPVVAAPPSAPKAVPDAAAPGQAAETGKKQIYDRIEGDHEVPGGPLKTNEEAPQPAAGAPGSAAPGSGTDGTPLPLPPPPGNGTGQQGALSADPKTDIASTTQAAGQGSAANSSVLAASNQQIAPTSGTVEQKSVTSASNGSAPLPEPTSSGTTAAASPPGLPAPVTDNPVAKNSAAAANGAPAAKAGKSPDALKKLVFGKKVKSLGSRPVVLVPPSKIAPPIQTASSDPAQSTKPITPVATGSNGLYGDAPSTTPIAPPPPLKAANPVVANAPPPAKPALALPATGAFVAQLASFNSKAEASAEYQRLAAKHGAIITRYAPLIETAQVAGATRYRLNLGPMASNEAAASVCSSLISAGERDCLVRRQ